MAKLDTYSTTSFVGDQIRRLGSPNVYYATDYGATGDGTTDDKEAIQAAVTAAASTGGTVIFLPGTYAVSSNVVLQSNVDLVGIGRPTIKIRAGATTSPALLAASSKSNIRIKGLVFDGNASAVSGLNTVTQTFQCTDIVFDDCYWKDTRGIAHFENGGTRCGVRNSRFYNCGTVNRTSLSDSDRKQAYAVYLSTFPFVVNCEFETTGLDQISITDSTNILVSDNRCTDNDAGTIYIANVQQGVIANNYVSNSGGARKQGGNGIDVITSSYLTINGNTCVKNGAAGILVGGGNSDFSISGNVCMNNKQRSDVSNHEGGITFDCGSGSSIVNVIVSGNVCDDDQGASTTQQYAIGIRDTGGTFSNIRIGRDNVLFGRDSGTGASNTLKVFQTTSLGAQPFPMTFNLADAATINFAPRAVAGRALCVIVNTNVIGDFYLRGSGAPTELTSTAWETTDTGSSAALYDDGASFVVLKNRTGLTRTFLVMLDGHLG
jgi:parallel beta-helix repeat protein